jgi:hypothetical protein
MEVEQRLPKVFYGEDRRKDALHFAHNPRIGVGFDIHVGHKLNQVFLTKTNKNWKDGKNGDKTIELLVAPGSIFRGFLFLLIIFQA